MNIIVLTVMAIIAAAAFYFIHYGGRPLRVDQSLLPKHDPAQWPRVAVLVPATGDTDQIAESLASLLGQDYPDYELIVATRDENDPASSLVAQTLAGHSRGRQIHSGPALMCGQKNHNLLSALKHISPDREVLVFCDSTRLAPRRFLKELVRPVALGQSLLASGYHHVMPQDDHVSTLGHAIVVMALHLTRGVDALAQPWGGSTAIGLSTFKALKVEHMWAENVVDDVSLAALLKKARVGVKATPAACLHTPPGWGNAVGVEPVADQATHVPEVLLSRNLAGPGSWPSPLERPAALCLLADPGAVIGWASPTAGWTSLIFLVIILALVNYGRSMHPDPGSFLPGMTASLMAILMASLCHFQTMLTSRIHWRGLAYNVTWSGRVTGVSACQGDPVGLGFNGRLNICSSQVAAARVGHASGRDHAPGRGRPRRHAGTRGAESGKQSAWVPRL